MHNKEKNVKNIKFKVVTVENQDQNIEKFIQDFLYAASEAMEKGVIDVNSSVKKSLSNFRET